MSSPASQTLPMPFSAPDCPPSTWDIPSLGKHLKTASNFPGSMFLADFKQAMTVELATIPLYLCAIYSIIDGRGSKPYKDILAISKQEMLHLTLAGNMLRAIGGTQTLYDKSFIPTYPSEIFYDKVKIKLGPADKKALESFVQVERPHLPQPEPIIPKILMRYRSIGQFYESVKLGIETLCPEGSEPCDLFRHNHDKQFDGREIFKRSGMVAVKDKASALEALEKIVLQGEGSHPDDPDSHYYIFKRLLGEHQTWKCYDYLEDPKTEKFRSTPFVYKLSLAFDALYCYLLQTIDRAWETSKSDATAARQRLIANILGIMKVMSRLAELLVAQKLNSGKSPAPCFEFYPPGGPPLSPENLFKGLKAELSGAAESGDADARKALEVIIKSIDGFKPTEP